MTKLLRATLGNSFFVSCGATRSTLSRPQLGGAAGGGVMGTRETGKEGRSRSGQLITPYWTPLSPSLPWHMGCACMDPQVACCPVNSMIFLSVPQSGAVYIPVAKGRNTFRGNCLARETSLSSEPNALSSARSSVSSLSRTNITTG